MVQQWMDECCLQSTTPRKDGGDTPNDHPMKWPENHLHRTRQGLKAGYHLDPCRPHTTSRAASQPTPYGGSTLEGPKTSHELRTKLGTWRRDMLK